MPNRRDPLRHPKRRDQPRFQVELRAASPRRAVQCHESRVGLQDDGPEGAKLARALARPTEGADESPRCIVDPDLLGRTVGNGQMPGSRAQHISYAKEGCAFRPSPVSARSRIGSSSMRHASRVPHKGAIDSTIVTPRLSRDVFVETGAAVQPAAAVAVNARIAPRVIATPYAGSLHPASGEVRLRRRSFPSVVSLCGEAGRAPSDTMHAEPGGEQPAALPATGRGRTD